MHGPRRPKAFSPAQLLSGGFVALILAGTVVLTLPWAAQTDRLSVIDAFFTATSAVCVTGLVVVDTPTSLSLFGQGVVLLLIQIGGLGYMAITTVVGVALGRHLSVQERRTLSEALNVQTMEGLVRFVFTVMKLTLAFEFVGALVLTVRWLDDLGPGRAVYYGVFHAVSAFNNAGFALFSDNMVGFRSDVVVNAVITTLVICGGLGFVVLTDIGRRRQTRRLSTHTRLVLGLTAGLLVTGTLGILLIERHNPATLGPLGTGEAALAAWFQAVAPRTAGFNSVDVAALMPVTLFAMMVLMFIGAAPGGTAGGVKITTFGITAAALWAMVRGDDEPSLLRRRLSPATVRRAFAICLLAFLTLNVVAIALLFMEKRDLLPTLFEATSAFGTVGLSMSEPGDSVSLSAHFGVVGKVLIALLMFAGRLGPLTLAVAVARRRSTPSIRYPEGKFLIG